MRRIEILMASRILLTAVRRRYGPWRRSSSCGSELLCHEAWRARVYFEEIPWNCCPNHRGIHCCRHSFENFGTLVLFYGWARMTANVSSLSHLRQGRVTHVILCIGRPHEDRELMGSFMESPGFPMAKWQRYDESFHDIGALWNYINSVLIFCQMT